VHIDIGIADFVVRRPVANHKQFHVAARSVDEAVRVVDPGAAPFRGAEAHPGPKGAGLRDVGMFAELVMRGLDPRIHPASKDFLILMDCRVIGERKRRQPSDGYARQ
jgi:hypothetical protein